MIERTSIETLIAIERDAAAAQRWEQIVAARGRFDAVALDSVAAAPTAARLISIVRTAASLATGIDVKTLRDAARRLDPARGDPRLYALTAPDDGAPRRRLAFVSGAPRSGTTALGALLNQFDDIGLFVERYGQAFGYHPWMFTDAALQGSERRAPRPQWARIERRLADLVVVGDKRPNFLRSWYISRENLDPGQVAILHITRDPRLVALSYQRRAEAAAAGTDAAWKPDRGAAQGVLDWIANAELALAVRADPRWAGSIRFVDYDRVFGDAGEAQRLAAFAGSRWSRRVDLSKSATVLQRPRPIPDAIERLVEEAIDPALVRRLAELGTGAIEG